MSKKHTIYDIAKKANVSIATVSRVLSKSSKVSPKTHEKVWKIIKEMQYFPNRVAASLASQNSRNIALILSEVSRPSISRLISGILDAASNQKYTIRIFSYKSKNNYEAFILSVLAEKIDGIIFLDEHITNEQIEAFTKPLLNANFPFTFINTAVKLPGVTFTALDFKKAVATATRHLIEKNTKRILFLTSKITYFSNLEKESGYLETIQAYNLKPYIFRMDPEEIDEHEFLSFFEKNKIEAIVATRDIAALKAISLLRQKNLKCGTDYRVVCMQNTNFCKLFTPQLTSISYSNYRLGEQALIYLTQLIENVKINKTQTFVEYELIERESSR